MRLSSGLSFKNLKTNPLLISGAASQSTPTETTFGTSETVGGQDGTVRDAKGIFFNCTNAITITQVAVPNGETSPTRLVISEVDASDVVQTVLYDVEKTPSGGVETWTGMSVALEAGKRYCIACHDLRHSRSQVVLVL